ncbi:MAG: hypothetical protein ETSY1_21845 [Candidatus Entotheonella factor]|uniref:Uncharacterized protein n=1 Tax=Entotheonella factor TaxID=1429438 RepID=W4LI92_ENTF1|nr:MAG: hypothetical protein ETSY1_21845 [Candidatus Entotheonella factor]
MTSQPVYTLPELLSLPASLPLDKAVRLELEEGVPVLRASTKVQQRIEALLQQQHEAPLTPEEIDELDRYEEIDAYLSLLNRIVRNQIQAQRA